MYPYLSGIVWAMFPFLACAFAMGLKAVMKIKSLEDRLLVLERNAGSVK